MRYLLRFFRLNAKDKKLLFQISIYSIWAYTIIHIIPFRKYMKWIDKPQNSVEIEKSSPQFSEIVVPLRRNIRRIERKAFWPTTCFSLAISARRILNKSQIKNKVFMGLTKSGNAEISAHAWTEVAGECITGCIDISPYSVIYTFE